MIGTHHLPKRTVDIRGDVDHPSFTNLAQIDLPVVGFSDPREYIFHWQIRIGWNKRYRVGKRFVRFYFCPVNSVDDAGGIFQAFKYLLVRTIGSSVV